MPIEKRGKVVLLSVLAGVAIGAVAVSLTSRFGTGWVTPPSGGSIQEQPHDPAIRPEVAAVVDQRSVERVPVEVASEDTVQQQAAFPEPSRRAVEAYDQVRRIAAAAGLKAPRQISGPQEMWDALVEADDAYGRPFVDAQRLYVHRLSKLVRAQDVSQMQAMPQTAGRNQAPAALRDQMKPATGLPVYVGKGGNTYVAHVDTGVDAELDSQLRDVNTLRAQTANSVASILRQYGVLTGSK